MILWISVFPTDVVKSRIQVSGLKTPMVRLMYQIARSEGKVFFFHCAFSKNIFRKFKITLRKSVNKEKIHGDCILILAPIFNLT